MVLVEWHVYYRRGSGLPLGSATAVAKNITREVGEDSDLPDLFAKDASDPSSKTGTEDAGTNLMGYNTPPRPPEDFRGRTRRTLPSVTLTCFAKSRADGDSGENQTKLRDHHQLRVAKCRCEVPLTWRKIPITLKVPPRRGFENSRSYARADACWPCICATSDA